MNAIIKTGKEINTQEWDNFVHQSLGGNIYHLHTYLSHLLPAWQAIIVMEGTQIVAGFPFAIKTKWGIRYGLQPYFSQYMGILFLQKPENHSKRLAFQKKSYNSFMKKFRPM